MQLIGTMQADIDVFIHAGDVGYADDSFLHMSCMLEFCYEAAFDNWMTSMESVTESKPYMVAVGNHESECHSPACLASEHIKAQLSNFTAYNARFSMPSLESQGVLNMWYSFDHGPVHFVFINTETDFPDAHEHAYGDGGPVIGLRAGQFAPEGAYLRWLEADLKAANERRSQHPWVVAVGHRPWVFEDGRETVDGPVKNAHKGLFQKYGVDLYVAGHYHTYNRLLPINGNDDIPTVVHGGAGCDEFFSDRIISGTYDTTSKNSQWDYRMFNADTSVATLEATMTNLTWVAYKSSSGEVFDSFSLFKKLPPVDFVV